MRSRFNLDVVYCSSVLESFSVFLVDTRKYLEVNNTTSSIILSGTSVVDGCPYYNIYKSTTQWTHYVIKKNKKMFKSAVTFNTVIRWGIPIVFSVINRNIYKFRA